jgi:orotate phosphoribosyltransferase/AMMECR1 domain-containing protein
MKPNREALRALLREQGILYASATQPIRHRDGAPAPWAFYSWNATLTSQGLRLAALCILERLQGFRATQLATVGYTGMPLLSACILLGEGRYTGLCIREQRKTSVSCRRVEGPLDRSAPVIIIDDSISSGTSLVKAIRAIEDEGAEVEGAIALVQFPHRGGLDWANAAGYRAEAIFDIWSDLDMARTLPAPRPRLVLSPGTTTAPEGLHPASLARFAAASYLANGAPPRPPRTLDGAYDCSGGVFVSFRERRDNNRIARSGFWHFDPAVARPPDDVVAATIETLHAANGQIAAKNLAQLKIAVTFLSKLEPIAPRGLDFGRYAIVAQSRIFPEKRGGALPNTQFFISEIEQYRQARETNAGIAPGEPHDLFRQDVVKHIEPGETWLAYGVPETPETAWRHNAGLGGRITARVRGLLERQLRSDNNEAPVLPEDAVPCPIEGVAVRLYDSSLKGYGVALGGRLDDGLRQAVAQAAADPRLPRDFDCERGAIVVSILHHPEELGAASIALVGRKLRRGLDALAVTHAGNQTVLLPSVLTYNNFTGEDFARMALRVAGAGAEAEAAADTGRLKWRTLQCAEWLDAGGQARALRFGFPDRAATGKPNLDVKTLIGLLGGYIARSIDANGLPRYLLLPNTGEGQARGTAGRAIHGLMALDRAGAFLDETDWRNAAEAGLRYCLNHVRDGAIMLPGCAGGTLADAVLLSAVADLPVLAASAEARSVERRLALLLRPDGRIAGALKRLDRPDDHEFLPGAVLAALGRIAAGRSASLPELDAQIAWYGRRFEACPGWGAAGWLPQGMAALHRVTANPAAAQLAFAATDWSLERQLATSGAFLEDMSPNEPSFNTGFIAEGVAASWAIALHVGDAERVARYAAAWREAMQFVARLVIYPEDVFAMRAGSAAIGGVRCTQSRSDIRVDQVSHCLHALVEGALLDKAMNRQ